jgi:hypothetical protein
VPEPHAKYTGETRFPLALMNSHRYFFFLASLLLLVNFYDATRPSTAGRRLRDRPRHADHGGQRDHAGAVLAVLPRLPARRRRPAQALLEAPGAVPAVDLASRAQRRSTGTFAMASLFTVILTDFYIMSLSAGWISDLRFIN